MFCTSCGQELDANCTVCSNCNTPIPNTSTPPEPNTSQNEGTPAHKKKKSPFRKLIYAVLAVIIILAFVKSLDPYRNILNVDTLREAYACSQEVICDDVLLDPSSAVFPKFEPDFVTQVSVPLTYEGMEFNLYTVTAYVDTNNAFGSTFRMDYTVEIAFPTDGDTENYIYNIISTNP